MRATAPDRVGGAILVVATAIGLLLGLAGPDTSPVAPGAAPVSVLSGLAGLVGLGGRDGVAEPRDGRGR